MPLPKTYSCGRGHPLQTTDPPWRLILVLLALELPPHKCLVTGLVTMCMCDELTEHYSKNTYLTNPNP